MRYIFIRYLCKSGEMKYFYAEAPADIVRTALGSTGSGQHVT